MFFRHYNGAGAKLCLPLPAAYAKEIKGFPGCLMQSGYSRTTGFCPVSLSPVFLFPKGKSYGHFAFFASEFIFPEKGSFSKKYRQNGMISRGKPAFPDTVLFCCFLEASALWKDFFPQKILSMRNPAKASPTAAKDGVNPGACKYGSCCKQKKPEQ